MDLCRLCSQAIRPGQRGTRDWRDAPLHAACYGALPTCPVCRHPEHQRADCGYCLNLSNCPKSNA